MDKYIGRLLDNRYEILEVIGTGGMAVVYKARCHRLNRLVAIKILKDDYLEDEDFRSRFHTESQAVAMLSHPNIVSVYDVSTSVSLEADYIVMELIEGISLKDYMEKKGVLNWKETLHFAMQIAKALQHAHSRGIVHRDIKPHNVMVLKNGSVKVTDFGIARMMSQGNTLTKEALGSVHYISPEQAKGGRVDDRSDIYSLGVVMYEMMAGRPPYDGESPVAVAIQHINGGASMPSTLNPNIPGGLEQIIMKAMATAPGKRYSSATEMLHDMDEFRKDPTILFDYNVMPLDAVTVLGKEERAADPAGGKTVAQKVERKSQGGAVAHNADVRRTPDRPRQRKQEENEESNRVAATAIIVCSAVAVVAIVVFLIVLLGSCDPSASEPLLVPQLVGESYEDVVDRYPDLNIIKSQELFDDTVSAGIILEQDPAKGTQVQSGDTVGVTVSLGKAPMEMGNILNYPKTNAQEYLQSMNLDLKLQYKEEYSEDVEEGSVIRTDPAAGEQLTQGQSVMLYISKGPETKISAMPNVIDRPQDSAVETLENQKLHLQILTEEIFDSAIEAGNVVSTDPEAGEELKTGQTVTLYISKGPELKTMPQVVGMDIGNACVVLTSSGFAKTPVIEYVESSESKDTVVEQSHEAYTDVEASTQIVLKVSKGPKTVTEATKDVVIDLGDCASYGEVLITVTRNGQVVYKQTVQQGTQQITIYGQKGTGMQVYTVIPDNNQDGWDVEVYFTDDE